MQTSSLVVTSAQGHVNVVDVSNTNTCGFYPPSTLHPHFPPIDLQLDTTSYTTSTAVSSNGTYLAFGDAVGTIHLLTAADESSKPFFNGFQGQPAEWADVPEPPPEIDSQLDRYIPLHEPPFFLDTSTPLFD